MDETLAKLDPVARKRYFYLRRILHDLPLAEREALGKLAPEERKKSSKKLLLDRGAGLFAGELARLSPAARDRFEALDEKQARRVKMPRVGPPDARLADRMLVDSYGGGSSPGVIQSIPCSSFRMRCCVS